MQIDGEHKLQPFSDLPRASLAFSISRLSRFFSSPQNLQSPRLAAIARRLRESGLRTLTKRPGSTGVRQLDQRFSAAI